MVKPHPPIRQASSFRAISHLFTLLEFHLHLHLLWEGLCLSVLCRIHSTAWAYSSFSCLRQCRLDCNSHRMKSHNSVSKILLGTKSRNCHSCIGLRSNAAKFICGRRSRCLVLVSRYPSSMWAGRRALTRKGFPFFRKDLSPSARHRQLWDWQKHILFEWNRKWYRRPSAFLWGGKCNCGLPLRPHEGTSQRTDHLFTKRQGSVLSSG